MENESHYTLFIMRAIPAFNNDALSVFGLGKVTVERITCVIGLCLKTFSQ